MAELNENVASFLKLYETDPAVKREVDDAMMNYPGSLEIRENVVEYALLPAAQKAGLPFTLEDLRRYELQQKMLRSRDVEIDPDEPDEEYTYWLLDHGWEDDMSKFPELK